MPIFPLLLIAAAAEPEPPTIVVQAERTGQALAECRARNCDVREDAIASIRHAQAQFAAGDYPEARKTLRQSLARNRKAVDRDPRALSALWHALARGTLHNGDQDEYRRAALRAGSIMAKAATVTPAERVRGAVQLADAMAATGDTENAVRHYRDIAAAARERGEIELAELMDIRAVYARSTFDGRPAARRALEKMAADERLQPRARTAALAAAAQLQDGRQGRVAALLDAIPVQPGEGDPLLVWKPEDPLAAQRRAIARAAANNDFTLANMLAPRGATSNAYRWADIGFWIRPDGRVAEAELLRVSGPDGWTRAMVDLVAARRYAPFDAAPGSEGRYKIERVTLTYDHQAPAGSLIRSRSGLPIYRFEDLKVESAPPPAGAD